MMYAITFVCTLAFTIWMMHKGAHWWDDNNPFSSADVDDFFLE